MPLPIRTECKVESCSNPPHVWPNGVKATYCQAHIRLRRARNRDGLPTATGPMLNVLCYLRDAKRVDQPFMPLGWPQVDNRTLAALIERDWIFASPGEDGTRYCITARGADALEVYLPRRNRGDKICPRCKTTPRHIRSSGQQDSYCKSCGSEIAAEKRAKGLKNGRVDRPCSRCHKRPRYRYPGGKYSTYCEHCARVSRRQNNRKQQRRLFKDVIAGSVPVPLCMNCKQSPRVVHPNCISKYCQTCKRKREESAKYKRVLRQKGIVLP